jgi:tryptophan-rich sensory protein
MQFIKLVLGFAPWLAFMFIAHDSLFRLKLGLIVALVLCLLMGLLRLHRGVILWAGLAFFGYAMIAVVWLENHWAMRHMGILANGALALSTWYTVITKRPFTLDYAREKTDPSLWNQPFFLRTNMIITSVWGLCFTISALLAWHKMAVHDLSDLSYELISYSFMLTGILFTNFYPSYLKRQRLAATAHSDNPQHP